LKFVIEKTQANARYPYCMSQLRCFIEKAYANANIHIVVCENEDFNQYWVVINWINWVWVTCDHYEKRWAYKLDFIWPVIVDVIGFKWFCYYGIGAIPIYAYTQMVFAKIPCTCKYNTHQIVLPC
jgi:hypothetical protein